jgi:4-amino-4-deoxy-L-arabinose transferase-like glycosyltransferase
MARLAPPRALDWEGIARRHGLAVAIAATVAIRLAAGVALAQPVESDALAYWEVARHLAAGLAPTDNWGNHAFYSPGYPLLLAPAFRLLGASLGAALAVNLLLAAATAALVWRLARALGGSALAATLAALGYAVWLPGVWEAAGLARENLSAPLLTAFACALLAVLGPRPLRASAAAGLCWAAGVLAGTSVVLTSAALPVALVCRFGRDWRAGGRTVLAFAAPAALVLAPWLATTAALVGRPVLTTSGGFNLYLGNNPAATARYMSMRDTPLGTVRWNALRRELGEERAGALVGELAVEHALAHPGRTAALGLQKLALFWAPNWPDAADWADSRALAAVRLVEVVQYLLIVALAALWLLGGRGRERGRERLVLAAVVLSFWATHAATYIIPRYRDPAMPVLIALAALALVARRRPADAR